MGVGILMDVCMLSFGFICVDRFIVVIKLNVLVVLVARRFIHIGFGMNLGNKILQ